MPNLHGSIGVNREATVRAAALRAPLELLICERSRLSARSQRELKRVAKPKFSEAHVKADFSLDVFDRAGFLAPDSEIFLRAGLSPNLGTLGLYGKSIVLSNTLWDAIKASRANISSFQSWAEVRLQLKSGRCRIIYESPLYEHSGNVAWVQYFVAMYVLLLRQAKYYSGLGLRLYFPNARSAHWSLFPEAEAIKSSRIGIVEFDDSLLRSPMKYADPLLAGVANRIMDDFGYHSFQINDLPELVEQLQSSALSSFNAPLMLRDTADLLDMPFRTLQGKLAAAGRSFNDIRNKAMLRAAKRALLHGRSIAETSQMLGFQNRQSFSEAFSKWEGQSPSVFRSRCH